jgi:deoxyribonuclease-4
MQKLLFGTAGIPISAKGSDTIEGIKEVGKLGLDAMELEFVRNVNISRDKAPEVRKTAERSGVELTCHGQYYINLNSKNKAKQRASVQRILNAARIAWLCGAKSVTFHAGFYMGMEPAQVYGNIKDGLGEIISVLKGESNKIWVRPETTGKPSQFGTLDEIIKLSTELEQVLPCVDFSHLYARSLGVCNSYKKFSEMLGEIEKGLGKKALKNMHMHVSGIEYGLKGERNHLNLEQSGFNYKELMKALKEFGVRGVLISESPNIEADAILMKRTYEGL